MEIRDKLVMALKGVYDPEIPVNIYDLGLIYEIEIDSSKRVTVIMTLTSPNCPMVDELLDDVHSAASMVPGVNGVDVKLTFEPPWDRSRMSDEALFELGMM